MNDQRSTLRYDDFTGGFTDNYMDGDLKSAQDLVNFVITDDEWLLQRPGSVLYSTDVPRPPGAFRIGALINFNDNDTLFIQSGRHLYYISGASALDLTGPGGASYYALSAGDTTNHVSYSEWRNHLFITNDGGSAVMKVFKDGSSVLQVRQAGLPGLDDNKNYVDATALAAEILLANDIQSKMVGHLTNAWDNHVAVDTTALAFIATSITGTAISGSNDITSISSTAAISAGDKVYGPGFNAVGTVLSKTSTTVALDITAISGAKTANTLNTSPILTNIGSNDVNYLWPGMTLSGTGIQVGTTIVTINHVRSAPTITMSLNATATNAGVTITPTYVAKTFYFFRPCTDQATMLALVTNLLTAYESHYRDALKGGGGTYHTVITPTDVFQAPTVALLESTTAPTDIETAAARLNNLRQMYARHEGDADTHQLQSVYYHLTTASIPNITTGPYSNIDPTPIYNLANNIRQKYNDHLSSSVAHPTAPDSVNQILSAAATTPASLATLLTEFRTNYSHHDYDATLASSWQYHDAQESPFRTLIYDWNDTTSGVSRPDYQAGQQAEEWSLQITFLADLKSKFNGHQAGAAAHTTDTADTFHATAPDVSLATYNYAFYYSYTYTVGSLTFEDRGPVTVKQYEDVIAIDTQPLTISGISVLTNTASSNYDTATIKVKIFRTTNAGTTYYFAGEVTNGTTTFTDRTVDTSLINNEQIYTAGGVVSNGTPPLARVIHIANNTGYYGYITDSDGTVFSKRILQSVPGDPDAVPSTFSDDLEDDVIGINSVKGVIIVFCKNSLYRLEGGFDLLGRGSISHVSISNTTGCESISSIVRIENALVFAGNDGFYVTDGYQVSKLNQQWEETYKSLVSTSTRAKNIIGTLDKYNKRVLWAGQALTASSDNDTVYCLHLNFGLKPMSAFSTWTNGSSFYPSALTVFNKVLLRADSRGYLFQHADTYLTDPRIDTGVTATSWAKKAIIYNYTSCATDFGQDQVRKWVVETNFAFKADSNQSVQIISINDDGRQTRNLTPIRFRGQLIWGDPSVEWGDESIIWDYQGLVTGKRNFPSGQLRCNYKQVKFTNAYVVIVASSGYGTATVDGIANTATLNTPGYTWPVDCEDYELSFDNDGYIRKYPVTIRTDTVLTFTDVDTIAPSGSALEWELWGYPKGEMGTLLHYSLTYAAFSQSPQDAGGTSGENS